MKTQKILIIVAATLASSFFANDADAGIRSWFRRHAPRPVFHAPVPHHFSAPIIVAPVHHHHYVQTSTQVWVAPVYGMGITGYDHHGNAIYGQVITHAGYYRTLYTNVCSGCGHSY